MQIIHLSDTHFGNHQPAFDLQKLRDAMNSLSDLFEKPDTYLVVSGDITFQGNSNGYIQARRFFDDTWLVNQRARNRFLACPGNHDICANSFQNFDTFLYGIRRNHDTDFSNRPHGLVKFDNIAFLMVNSASHLNHKYGLIDFQSLKTYLEIEKNYLDSVEHRIAVVHHHLIGFQENDTSTIRNALPFIALLDKFEFHLILHGHQHSQISLQLGKSKMAIFSARSLNYRTSSLVNGINILSYEKNAWNCDPRVLSADNSMINGPSLSKIG
ncbi:MAG: metallophosphoesterase [Methylococcaceae bacterium]|nr:metallophosphoesterase [Methylococcaceae bacterium]